MTLIEAIDAYVERKRASGLSFEKGRLVLLALCRHVGDMPLHRVSGPHVLSFLDDHPISALTWRHKHRLLKRFFEFWLQRGAMPLLLMPQARPPSSKTFSPYIYTRAEIRSLLQAARQCQTRNLCVVDAVTFRCLILTLYATGGFLGEILNLHVKDIHFRRRSLTLPGNRIIQSRCIPISLDLQKDLRAYVTLKHGRRGAERSLFLTKAGLPIKAGTVEARFKRLRRISGIGRQDGSVFQPRLLDLRASFAVHRITSWIKERADLNRMLPALAAYMGNVSLTATEQYLALTPERFRRELQKLSPEFGKKHWRDDPALMKFLTSL